MEHMVLSSLVEEPRKLLHPAVAPHTFFEYRLSFQQYIELMGDVDISSITPIQLELWKNKLGITLSPTTVSFYFRTLKSLFNKAKKMGLIDIDNPGLQDQRRSTLFSLPMPEEFTNFASVSHSGAG